MKKIFSKLAMGAMLFSIAATAQIENAKTEIFKVYGNCGMCKKTIENSATEKRISQGVWNKDTHELTLTYNTYKTSADAVLKKVAYAGYDNEKYLAPNEAYNNLPGCCQYDRPKNEATHSVNDTHTGKNTENRQEISQEQQLLKNVYELYFNLKDALVKSDAGAASSSAVQLVKVLKEVPMDKMDHNSHIVWMKQLPILEAASGQIAKAKDITKQREAFAKLSAAMYEVAKAFESDETLYYQNCPMYDNGKGANWLSRDKAIKNPYYGNKMLTCGSTIETIK